MIEGATMSGVNRKQYFAPWLDRATGLEYGPKTHATFAKHHAAHRDWSFRVSRPSKVAQSATAAELRLFMRLEDGTLRTGLPEGEARCYLYIVECGHSERAAAVKLGISRRTVRSYMMRLSARLPR